MKIGHWLALVALLAGLQGCACAKKWWPGNQMRVESSSYGAATGLTADEIVRAMRQAGFSDEEILALGAKLRNEIAESGSARIAKGDGAEAVFAADAGNLYVSSRQAGSFSLPLQTSQIAQQPPEPARPAPRSQIAGRQEANAPEAVFTSHRRVHVKPPQSQTR